LWWYFQILNSWYKWEGSDFIKITQW
jgi:hypothetical protein